MRVLHIGKFYPPHAGGIERFNADLAGALTARGVANAVLAHASPGTRHTQYMDHSGVDVALAGCRGLLVYAPISPAFPGLLSQTIARFRPDLLHIHVPNTSAFWALLSPAARSMPWILQWQSDVPSDAARLSLRLAAQLYRPWETAMLRRARAIIASSRPYLETSKTLAPWRGKTEIIPLGIGPAEKCDDAPGAQPRPTLWPVLGDTCLRVLAVGRLSYYKGFDVLLRAIARVRVASLLLIGSGECEAQLKTLAHDLGIEARVRFAGHVDDATLARAYREAQVFCLPSIERTEAFGMVLLEAMRARLPVIASAIAGSGVGYVVADGVSGILVPPGDDASLAKALERVAGDEDLRACLGAGGAARWRDEFTLDRCADRVLDLYRSIVAQAAHRAAATQAG